MKRNYLAAAGRKLAIILALAQPLPAAAGAIEVGSAAGAAYRNRPVRLLVGLPPGGSTDLVARIEIR